jgi:hypothetical protein
MKVSLENLRKMSPKEFECSMAALLRLLGFRAEETQLTRDGGVDIWATSDAPVTGGRLIVQCKRYAAGAAVGEPVIRELYGLVHAHGVNKGVLVTTSEFTVGALRFAEGKPLELIDGAKLLSLMAEANQATSLPGVGLSSNDGNEVAEPKPSTLIDLRQWIEEYPLPHPLVFTVPPSVVWMRLDRYPCHKYDVDLAPFHLREYYEAAYHLLKDAEFKPEANSIPVRDLILARLRELKEIADGSGDPGRERERGAGSQEENITPMEGRVRRYASMIRAQRALEDLTEKSWWTPPAAGLTSK